MFLLHILNVIFHLKVKLVSVATGHREEMSIFAGDLCLGMQKGLDTTGFSKG